MRKKKFIFGVIASVLLQWVTMAQKPDDVVFSVAGKDVTVGEFTRVYEKNLSLVTDPGQKDIENYLDLYINYKLKLQEAFDKHYDTISSYLKEYNRYRDQLLNPYLKDKNLERDFVREAYERMKYDVNASHILLFVRPDSDTLKIYNRLNAIRDSILAGASFEKMAKKYSDDKSAKKNGGNLGYFTVFDMVYPFESAAYNTQVGQISPVFRTRFGYHIVKVLDKRPARGKVQVSHIMTKGDDAENQIRKIKEELDKGGNFADLARQYSQDKGSAKRGGLLGTIGVGKTVKEFEDVAFSLKRSGEISEPFKTRYGWHIIKLAKKIPIGSFEEEKAHIEKKVKEGKRAELVGKSILNKLYKEYHIEKHPELITGDKQPDAVILKINDRVYKASDFYSFYEKNKRLKPEKAFAWFTDNAVRDYYKSNLEKNDPEIKYTLLEYREGLLLFELMKRKIWDFAEKDTTGLENFFNAHRDNYVWKQRADADMIICSDEEVADRAVELLNTGDKELSDIRKELLEMNKGIVKMKSGKFETGSGIFPEGVNFDLTDKAQKIKDKTQFVVVRINALLPPGNKELNECKGKVISDYQDELEKKWLNELREKYPVKINKKTLRKLKRKYKKYK